MATRSNKLPLVVIAVCALAWSVTTRAYASPAWVAHGFVGNAEIAAPIRFEPQIDPHRAITTVEPIYESLASGWHMVMPTLSSPVRRTSAGLLQLRIALRAAIDRIGIGGTWSLGHGRRLVMDLTPSPRHCAPLIELDF
jgi:hypothetical protein